MVTNGQLACNISQDHALVQLCDVIVVICSMDERQLAA